MTRDIYFNKEEVFNSNLEIFKYNIKNISLKYLVEVIRNTIRRVIIIILLIIYNNTAENLEWFYKSEGNKEIRPLEDLILAWRNKYIIIVFKLLPIPPDLPLKCLFIIVLIMAMLRNAPSKSLLSI